MPVHKGIDTLPPGVQLSFLESQMTATNILESALEYKYWLLATVNHLLAKGINLFLFYKALYSSIVLGPECRLRVILDELMGPYHSSAKKKKQNEQAVNEVRF